MSAVRQLSANLSLSLQETSKQVFADVQQDVNRLDRKKGAVAEAGLQRVQENNSIASRLSEQRSKIDTYA